MQMVSGLAMNYHMAILQAATLPITPTSWIPIATIAVLTIIVVAAMVYMLSNVIRNENAKAWSRFQIYEGLLSILLLVIFGSITYLFFLNPQPTFSAIKIVPQGCTSATQLFTLAPCDVSQFNNATFSIAKYAIYVTYITSAVSLTAKFDVEPIPLNPYINFTFDLSTLPIGIPKVLSIFDGAVLLGLLFNQVQLIVLAGAVLFLAFFLSLGLVARTLGFARTFGGAMIAFGLGIGIIYPLLVSITYGYVDVSMNVACLQMTSCAFTTLVGNMYTLIFSSSTSYSAALGVLFTDIGYLISGLFIIPLINLAIVDAFIVDFSSAIGERMSFGQLFSNLI